MYIWKEESFKDKIYDELESFFDRNDYSKNAETLALNIIDSLRTKNILVVKKTANNYGYLIPLIYASKDKRNFKVFIISVTLFTLKEQLKTAV